MLADMLLFNNVAGEVWSYGDCQCRIGEELHCEEKEVDRLLSELRAFVIMSGMREQAARMKMPVQGFAVPHGTEVVLESDGYPQLCRTLEESEAKLREIIAEDPLCLGVGGGKAGVKGIMDGMESFDDRAYVRALA